MEELQMTNKEPIFYFGNECNVIIEEIQGNQSDYSCNGKQLKKLIANSTEAATEKHLPQVDYSGNIVTVNVGSVSHPMSEEHSIEWVYLQTKNGCQKVNLKPNEAPIAKFALIDGDTPIAAYAYCNLHGFWKTEF